MSRFRHAHRSVFLFILLTPLTLFIYPIVVLTHVGEEINRICKFEDGYKRSMNYVGVFFLGLITLGIVPLVWMTRVSRKIGEAAWALDIRKPHTSGLSYFLLCFLFGEFIIPWIVGMCKFLHTLNRVEQELNDRLDSEAIAAAEAEILPVEEESAPEEETPKQPSSPKRKWRVHVPGSEGFKVFDTKEEALAYAEGLAAKNKMSIRLK